MLPSSRGFADEILWLWSTSVSEFASFPKLVRADISSSWFPLEKFLNVEFLRMDVVDFTHPALTFHNLIHMELSVSCCDWCLLVELIMYCPMLQILVIDDRNTALRSKFDLTDRYYPQSVRECISSHLRACSLTNFLGIHDDLRFARYIMQNARVLRTMKICSTSSSNIQAKFQMLKNLSQFPRSSTSCELLFE